MKLPIRSAMRYPAMRLALVALLLVAVQALPAQTPESQVVRRFGVFVGANNGGSERVRLQWAVSDALRMSQVMTELGGLAPEDSLMLNDPRQSDIQQALTGMRLQVAKAQSESRRVEFMFYYSGHSDEEGLLVGNDRFTYKTLRQAITDVKADVTIAVLDSCASGAFTRTKGGVRIQPFLVDASNDMRGYAFLTSASETEAAQESDRLGASFFTHYLVSALRGAANTTGSGRVTLNDAYRYAFNETLARTEASTSGPQHPSYDINLSGTGDLVLSDLSQPSASILLQEDMEGRVFVRDAKGYLVMEVNKVLGKSTTLAMQPGNYTLRIETPTGTFQAPARLALKQQYSIGMANFQKAQLVATRSRGNTPAAGSAATGDGAAAPGDAALAADPLVANVLEQARARYARNQFKPEAPDSGTAPGAPDQATQPATDSGTDISINVSLPGGEGIGVWELINQLFQAPTELPAVSPAPADGSLPHVLLHFSVVPGVGSAGANAVESTFTFSPLIGSVAANNGMMASLLINLNGGLQQGVQFTTLINRALRLEGGQFAAIGNIAAADSAGYQAGGVFNVAGGKFDGFQSASIFNIASGATRGLQSAGIFNYAGDASEAFQAAGVFNIAGSLTGMQAAGLFNRATSFSGLQLAGLLNANDESHGVAVAPINVMGKFDGLPIGVVNIIGNGIHDISYWYSAGERSWFGFLNGATNFYSIAYAGFDLFNQPEEAKGLTIGLGVGGRLKFADILFADLEVSVKRPSFGANASERAASLFSPAANEIGGRGINLVPSLRLDGGLDLKHFKAFAGLSLDFCSPYLMSPGDYQRDTGGWKGTVSGNRVDLLAGFILGASLSF